MDPLRFDGRVGIVTGGGRGIGRAHCLLLASRGCKVLVNNRTPENADEVVAEIAASGGTAAANYDNVGAGCGEIVAHAVRLWGRVDIVVCNAGQLADGTFVKMKLEDFTDILNTHVVGHFSLVQAAWPHFRQQMYGRIVVIGSASGFHGNFGQANYAAAKGALVGLSQTWAMEGFKYGILCNVISTGGYTRMRNGLQPEVKRKSDAEMAGIIQPAAVPVCYLCHEVCKTTAGVFRVEGGHVQSYRWQADEEFVDFHAEATFSHGLEDVASQWPLVGRWEKVSYPGQLHHAASPIGAERYRGFAEGRAKL